MLSKNTGEGVHLIKKLPAVSLQASKFTKNELLDTSFSRILARFLFIVLFLGIISWKGVSCFSREGFFQMGWGGFIFKWGGVPHGVASVLVGGGFEKICKMGGMPPCPPRSPHYGKPCPPHPPY